MDTCEFLGHPGFSCCRPSGAACGRTSASSRRPSVLRLWMASQGSGSKRPSGQGAWRSTAHASPPHQGATGACARRMPAAHCSTSPHQPLGGTAAYDVASANRFKTGGTNLAQSLWLTTRFFVDIKTNIKRAIGLKKKIFLRWIDEQPHIGDIPANEVPISLVEEHPDVLRTFYHVSL